METLVSHNHIVWESLKSKQFKDTITEIVRTLSDCSHDDIKIESIECRIDNVDKRIGDLKDKFMEQQEMMEEWMKNVRKEKHNGKEFRERLKDQHSPKSKVQDTTDGLTSSLLSETQSSICEVVQKPMRRNFLLIGLPGSGKSATGNLILLKKVFKTGPKKSDTSKASVQHATVTLSGVPIEITVVISRGEFVDVKAFDLCPEGFDAVLNVVRYDQFFSKAQSFMPDEFSLPYLDKHFPHRALIALVVLIVTGGDMYDFDNPDKQEEEQVRIESTQFRNLKSLCQDRVILFDNLTKSELKQHRQVEKLLATINSFQVGTDKFTREWYGEVLVEVLKEQLSKLHLPQHYQTMFRLAETFSFVNSYGNSKALKDLQRIQMSLKKLKPFKDTGKRQEVIVVGEPCDAILSALARMDILCLSENHLTEPHYRDLHILVVIPCTGLSKIEKLSPKVINMITSRANREKSILIVIDEGKLNLSDDKTKFIEWCEQQTGLFKDIYQACSGRALVFSDKTYDVVLRIEQEAELLVILNRIYTERYFVRHDRWGGAQSFQSRDRGKSKVNDQINSPSSKAPDVLKKSFLDVNVDSLKTPPKYLVFKKSISDANANPLKTATKDFVFKKSFSDANVDPLKTAPKDLVLKKSFPDANVDPLKTAPKDLVFKKSFSDANVDPLNTPPKELKDDFKLKHFLNKTGKGISGSKVLNETDLQGFISKNLVGPLEEDEVKLTFLETDYLK